MSIDKNNIKFSIVMPVYNSEKYLDRSIKSVLNQTYKNYELIIVDDGSSDKSVDICSLYSEKHSCVKLILLEHKGVVEARYCGIYNSTGDYIVYLDSDDEYMANALQDLNEVLKLHNDIDMILYRFYYHYKEGNIDSTNFYCQHTKMYLDSGFYDKEQIVNEIYPQLFLLWNMHAILWTVCVKRTIALNYYFPEDNLKKYEVAEILYLELLHTNSLYLLDKPLYVYYVSNENSRLTSVVFLIEDFIDYTNIVIPRIVGKYDTADVSLAWSFLHNYFLIISKTISIYKQENNLDNKCIIDFHKFKFAWKLIKRQKQYKKYKLCDAANYFMLKHVVKWRYKILLLALQKGWYTISTFLSIYIFKDVRVFFKVNKNFKND